MRAYSKLTPRGQMLLALPLVALGYPIVTMLLPALYRALVPEVVRSVLHLI